MDFLASKRQLAPSFDWVLVDVVCPMLGILTIILLSNENLQELVFDKSA